MTSSQPSACSVDLLVDCKSASSNSERDYDERPLTKGDYSNLSCAVYVQWRRFSPCRWQGFYSRHPTFDFICVASKSMSLWVLGVTTQTLRRNQGHLSPRLPPSTQATPDDDDAIPWRILLDRPCLLPCLVFCDTTAIPSRSGVTYFVSRREWWCTSCVSTACVSGGPCPPARPVGVCVLWWCVPGGDLRPPPTSPVRCARPLPGGSLRGGGGRLGTGSKAGKGPTYGSYNSHTRRTCAALDCQEGIEVCL